MSKVVLVRCEDYEYSKVKKAVEEGITLLGGAEQFAKPGEKILFKPNWLGADPPEKLTTTHPSIFKAMLEVFESTGATFTYGDSPALQSPELAAKKCGFLDIAKEKGINMADFKNGRNVHVEKGIQNKKFFIANGVLDCDGIISLPKMKTHAFERVTGSIKNQFGCVPGILKGEFHVRTPNAIDFARMLVDLNLFLSPRLYVMDAIIAMEGNGPRGGKANPMQVLLFSSDPVALDATVCRMMDINPEFVPTTILGQEVGMGTWQEQHIEIVGEPLANFIDKNYDIKREPIKPFVQGKGSNIIQNALVSKPIIIESKCTKCGSCVDVCPVNPKAVNWFDGNKKNTPTYKYEHCIRCYCCQELCPESAVELKVPLLRKLFRRWK